MKVQEGRDNESQETTSSSTAARSGRRAYNSLLFSGLMLGLITASAGTLIRQWIQQYLESDYGSTPRDHVCMRQYRYEALKRWNIPLFVGLLSVTLRIAFIVSATGLAIRLFDFDPTAAIWFAVLGGIWVSLSILAAILPSVFSSCPYRSPESLLVVNIVNLRTYGLPLTRGLHRIYWDYYSSNSFLIRLFNFVYHLLLYVLDLLFYLAFRLPSNSLWRFVHRLPVIKAQNSVSWKDRDYRNVILLDPYASPPIFDKVKDKIRATSVALKSVQGLGLNGRDDTEACPTPSVDGKPQNALDIFSSDPIIKLNSRTLPPTQLEPLRKQIETLMRPVGATGLRGHLDKAYGGRRYIAVTQGGKLVRALDSFIGLASDRTSGLAVRAVIDAFSTLTPSPSLMVSIAKCVETFDAPEALQIVHRIALMRMPASVRTGQANIGPKVWKGLWRHWDEPDNMVKCIDGLTKSGFRLLLTTAANAVSKSHVAEGGGFPDDRCFIGNIAKPAGCCIATLLIRGTNVKGFDVDKDLRKIVAHAILKLLGDYKEPEEEQESNSYHSPSDGWSGTPRVALRAAIRLCEIAPSDADDFFVEREGFVISKSESGVMATFRPTAYTPYRENNGTLAGSIL